MVTQWKVILQALLSQLVDLGHLHQRAWKKDFNTEDLWIWLTEQLWWNSKVNFKISKILSTTFSKWMLHLGNYISVPFFNSQNKAFRFFILKQYIVPILVCCWKTLLLNVKTYFLNLNKRVTDCLKQRKMCPHDSFPTTDNLRRGRKMTGNIH